MTKTPFPINPQNRDAAVRGLWVMGHTLGLHKRSYAPACPGCAAAHERPPSTEEPTP